MRLRKVHRGQGHDHRRTSGHEIIDGHQDMRSLCATLPEPHRLLIIPSLLCDLKGLFWLLPSSRRKTAIPTGRVLVHHIPFFGPMASDDSALACKVFSSS
ncbi:hypothetical protein BRADI_4g30215v3 [Brachypodium distachyon]|uniref:Uncharacterized protein n=1 Tax=Brachypodium distachyon TaxID=15368 RepID=A0A2K2CR95_BRADI|nr:hypothetical protein BRADI_4g30215v3 [Brachypodium distachyon]